MQCQPGLRPLGRQCQHCALPLPELASAACGSCLNNSQRLDHAHAGFEYNDALRSMIHALKFHHKLALAPLLGELLAQQIPASSAVGEFDVLIPAPLHIARLRQRGFNQAVELCRPLAVHAGLPMRSDLMARTRATRKQTRLDKTQRKANVHDAFSAHADVHNLNVVIFDDVMTTGATLNAMACALRRAGARKVAAITLARVI